MSRSKPEDAAPEVRLNAAPPLDPQHAYESRRPPGGQPPHDPAGRCRRDHGRCRRRIRGQRLRPGRLRAGRDPSRPRREDDAVDQGRQARRDPDAGEPVVRPLLRHAARRPRLRRQAGARAPRRRHDLPQPDPTRTDGGHLLPFRLDSAKYNAQNAGGLDHSLGRRAHRVEQRRLEQLGRGQVRADHGLLHPRGHPVPARAGRAFTIADDYHCSLIGPTTPNRLYQWTGTIDPAGGAGRPGDRQPGRLRPGLQLDAPIRSACRRPASPGRPTPTTRSATTR